MTEDEKHTKAWIGDAVLALFAREWILRQPWIKPKERAERFIEMTSNKFLSAIGPLTLPNRLVLVSDLTGPTRVRFQYSP